MYIRYVCVCVGVVHFPTISLLRFRYIFDIGYCISNYLVKFPNALERKMLLLNIALAYILDSCGVFCTT